MGGRRARVVLAMATGTAGIQFKKYHGLGNDFVLIDNRHQSEPVLSPEVRRSAWLYLSIYPVSLYPSILCPGRPISGSLAISHNSHGAGELQAVR